jgi:hypothetical protein
MISSWWKPFAGIALLAGAYIAGTYHPRADVASEVIKAKEAPDRESTSSAHETQTARTKINRAVGQGPGPGFKPAAPFRPGGARDWFIATTRVNHEDSITGFIQLIQNCTTLDERSAVELAEELREICKLYDDGDPTMRALFNGDDLQRRSLGATIFRLSQLNPDAAIRFLDESTGFRDREMGELYEMVFANYALMDPGLARDALARMDEGKLPEAIEGAMATLTGKDSDAAFELLSRFDQPSLDNERRKLVERIAAQDPQKAIETAGKFASAGRNPDVFASLLSTWMKKDEAAAIAWAETYRGPGEIAVKDVLIRRTAAADPKAAAVAFTELGIQTADLVNTGHVIADGLAKLDLSAAGEWVKSLPPGNGRDAAEHAMLDIWLEKDPMEASKWIREMPAGDSRDAISVSLVRAITRQNPKEALEWATSLNNPETRETLQREVIESMNQQDSGAAGEENVLPALPGR